MNHPHPARSELLANLPAFLAMIASDDVPFENACGTLATRLSQLMDTDVEISVLCPVSRRRNAGIRTYVSIASNRLAPRIKPIRLDRLPPLASSSRGFYFDLEDLERFHRNGHVVVAFDTEISPEVLISLKEYSTFFIKLFLRRQWGQIRQNMVDARVLSADLSSFLYRLIANKPFMAAIGAQAASIFISDPKSSLLRLQGTTGTKRNLPRSDIFFDPNHKGRVASCARTQTPLVEYNGGGALNEGNSAEKLNGPPYARAYWPIQLRQGRADSGGRRAQRAILGVIRVVRGTCGEDNIPFSCLDLANLSFAAESLYNVSIGFIQADEASFKRDEAFHASASAVDTIRKNINRVSCLLFGETNGRNRGIKQIYQLVSSSQIPGDDGEQARRLLRTAYASAMDIGFQIERANFDFPHEGDATTPNLVTAVLIRALEVVPDMCVAYSVHENIRVTTPRELLELDNLPPAVKGSPEALTSVFINILENAIKYRRPKMPIQIRIRIESDPKHVHVWIRDYGIGVDQRDVDKLALRHFRSVRARAHTVRGSGLGLSWCTDVLKAYDGGLLFVPKRTGLDVCVTLKRTET